MDLTQVLASTSVSLFIAAGDRLGNVLESMQLSPLRSCQGDAAALNPQVHDCMHGAML